MIQPLLTESLRGASVLYNTYWVRFPHGGMTHERAVENSRTLFRCAAAAGVKRIVHISITNPDSSSPLTYFRGKALVEKALFDSGLAYSILRPAVLFGGNEILINNIAWMLRRLPVFGVFGNGRYQLQPTYVDDLADLAVAQGVQSDNTVLDAVGPETYTYIDLVQLIRKAVQSHSRIIRLPPALGLAIGRLIGWWQNDVPITRQEIEGLMGNLLVSHQSPTCPTRFSEWLEKNAGRLGSHYESELSRRKS